MNVSASTPTGLISACMTAIQGYYTMVQQAEESVAVTAQTHNAAAPAGVTHLPAVASTSATQESTISHTTVPEVHRAYEANAALGE